MVTVMLWESHQGGSGPANAGHASLSITRPGSDGRGNQCVAMITWFPGAAVTGTSSSMVRTTQDHSTPKDLVDEMSRFMAGGGDRTAYLPGVKPSTPREQAILTTKFRPPNRVCRITSLSDPEALIGLSDADMLHWWEEYQKRRDYNLLTRNCSTAVAGGLLAGGGAAFASPPGLISWTPHMWTPHKVYDWAVAIQKEVEPRNEELQKARALIEPSAPAVNEDVWGLVAWKAKSSISMAHRYQVLKEIDALLEEYGKLRKEISAKVADSPSDLELPLLGKLLAKICQQMVERPDSARRESVVRLGGQVLNRANRIKAGIARAMEQRARERAALLAPLQKRLDQIPEEKARLWEDRSKLLMRMVQPPAQTKAKFAKLFPAPAAPVESGAQKPDAVDGEVRPPTPDQVARKRLLHSQLLQRALGMEDEKAREIQEQMEKIP